MAVNTPRTGFAQGWWATAIFTIAAMVSYTDRFILSLLIDPLERELGISDAQVSILQGLAFVLLYGAMGVVAGRLADRTNRRRLILLGIAIWSAATIANGFAQSFAQLVVCRVFVGIGEAVLMPAAVSMLADMFPPERRGMPLAMLMMGMLAGNGVAFILGGALLDAASSGVFANLPVLSGLSSWRVVMVVAGLPGALLILMLLTVREPVRRADGPDAALGRAAPLRWLWQHRRPLAPIYLGCAALSLGDFAFVSWAPALMIRDNGMAPSSIGYTFGILAIMIGVVASLAGGFAAGRLRATRFGDLRMRVMAAASLLAVAGAGALLVPGHLSGLVAIAIWGTCSAFAQTLAIPVLQDRLNDEVRGLATSFGGVFNIILGLGIGPMLVPLLAGMGLSLAMALLCATALGGVAALLLFAGDRATASRRPDGAGSVR